MRIAVIFLSITLLILTGCAGMSKDECLLADWQTIGFEDGVAGRSAAAIGNHRKACAKHGIAPDKTAYDTGYNQGILNFCSYGRGRSDAMGGYTRLDVCPSHADYHKGFVEGLDKFCTYESGYDYGLTGRNYHRTCARATEAVFLQGYDTGKEIYALQSQLVSLQEELQSIKANRKQNEHDQDALKQQLVLDPSLTYEQRAQILLDIDALRDEDDDMEKQKDQLLVQIADTEAQLKGMGVEI